MFNGRFEHNMDAKGRLFVPAKFREKLGEEFVAAVVIDKCICLYSAEEWDKLEEGLSAMPLTKARRLQQYLSSNATDVTVDSQGRILLARHLIDHAGLTKPAVIIGAGNHAEIWEPAAFEEHMSAMTPEEVEAEFVALGF